MSYTPATSPNGDLRILDDVGMPILWSNADFQAWLAQQTPAIQATFQLSTGQQAIQQAKQATFAQFQTWLNNQYGAPQPAGVARLLYELMQRALKSEIV